MADERHDVLQDVLEERRRQDAKWGEQWHTSLYWLGILMEEVGETSKAIIERKSDDIRKELVQVAAVAVAWLENIERAKNLKEFQTDSTTNGGSPSNDALQ